MIRILHMIGSLNIGGSQAMIMNLYRNIYREKIQFDFILDHPEQLYFAEEVKKLGGKIYFMPTFNGKNASQVKRAWNSFFEKHPEYKVLHSHVRSYASIYLPIAKKHGLKIIIHSHSTSNGSGIKSYIKWLMQLPLRFQADYFFGCSREAGEWLFGKKVVNSDKYNMLQNAIDTKKYAINDTLRKQYRDELSIGEHTLVFMHVGRLHEAKNHHFLLEVFSKYHSRHADSILVLVGDGELRKEIENKVNDLGINDTVKMLGARNDVPNLLQAADCFLFPSKWEGLPVTVVEAQAAGLPCLVSDTVTRDVNVSDLVENLPIDHGIDSWVNAIENMNFSKKDVTEDIVKSGFDIQDSAEWMEKFYRGLLNE